VVRVGILVPFGHDAHRIGSSLHVGAYGGPVATQGAKAAHAGDDNALHQHRPPLTASTWRVMYPASFDIRKATAAATSWGWPIRCAGTALSISSTGTWASIMSVSIKPGATQLTVIWRLPSSTASALAAPIRPALDAL